MTRRLLPLLLALAAAAPAWAQPRPGAPELGAAIRDLAEGQGTALRMEAARRLGASRDPRALEPLAAALKDASRDVRWAAIEALGELGDARAVEPLVEYLKRPEAYRWGHRLAANALGAIGDPRAVEPLAELLHADEDPFARRAAALALIRIGDVKALSRVGELVRGATDDETLGTVRRELARAAEAARPGRTVSVQPPPGRDAAALRPREWAGVRVGSTRLAEARERFGKGLRDSPEGLLYPGDHVPGPLRTDSVVINADPAGLVESIFVFPVWGTVERDTRALLGPGKIMRYDEFLNATGRTARGAGTRVTGKLHYLPPATITESYPEMGVLVVYDTAEAAARDRLVKLVIIY